MFAARKPLGNSSPSCTYAGNIGTQSAVVLEGSLKARYKRSRAGASKHLVYDSSSIAATSSPARSLLESDNTRPSTICSSPPQVWSSPQAGKTDKACNDIDITDLRYNLTLKAGDVVHVGRKLTSRSRLSPLSPGHRLRLPKAAKHASRHHCTVKCLQTQDHTVPFLQIEVFGQNGMLCQGQTIPCGQHTVPITYADPVSLGFYCDFEVVLTLDDEPHAASMTQSTILARDTLDEMSNYFTSDTAPLDSRMQSSEIGNSETLDLMHLFSSPAKSRVSLLSPHSSPLSVVSAKDSPRKANDPTAAISRENKLLDYKSDKRQRIHVERSSSAAPSPYAHQDDDGYPPESSDEDEQLDQAETERKAHLARQVAELRDRLQSTQLDLPGCLASAMVFQPRATLTTSECTSVLLEDQPALVEYGAEPAWNVIILRILRNGPFGCIDTKGLKDAAGKQIEPSWHYVAARDEDLQRKASLAPFVKQIRSTQRERKQYFYKRPSDLSKRKKW